MYKLIAVGGIHVPGSYVKSLVVKLDNACENVGFPSGEEFKWSPSRNMWMYGNLKGEDRSSFFRNVLNIAGCHNVTATVVIEDTKAQLALKQSTDHEHDVVNLFFERAEKQLHDAGSDSIVIFDRPGGGIKEEKLFLSNCMKTLNMGTSYVDFTNISMALATDSKLARPLQLADLITGCTLAFVAGEKQYSRETFAYIKPLLKKVRNRIGGVGVKIHPDVWYRNLYYWLFNDSIFYKNNECCSLPDLKCDYYKSAEKK